MIFVGDDWSEDHHDIDVIDERGQRLARRRLPEGVAGVSALHDLLAELAEDPEEVVIGIETDRGLWVAALVAAGYLVYAVNPKAVARYRERYGGGSGAKSDPGDAKVLADLVRTDRHNHRPVAGDSPQAQAIKVLARAQQRLVWARRRQLNRRAECRRESGRERHARSAAPRQAAFTGIVAPLASGALGSVTVSTPSLNAAVTLPDSTAAGRRIER